MTQQVSQPRRALRQLPWLAILTWLACLAAIAWAAYAGARLQRTVWDTTEPIRFLWDINNAYNKGQRAHQEGLLNVYDNVAAEARSRDDGVQAYDLDYPPLRLTVAYLWYDWSATRFGPGWQNTYAFHAPLLMLNRVLLAMAALSAMGLVWHFRRADRDEKHPPMLGTGCATATMAGMLAWFSPAALLVGFAWPQWDIAVPAFFLLAVLCGCRNLWLLAGVLLGIGGMYKGQVLLMLPMMVVWPLVAGKPGGLTRLLAGLGLSIACIAAPFMLHIGNVAIPDSAAILIGMAVLCWCVALGWKLTMGRLNQWFTLAPVAMIVLLAFAAWYALGISAGALGLALGAAIILLTAKVPTKYTLAVLAGTVASVIFICAWSGPASWNWLRVGLLYGTEHFQVMYMGNPSNLPAILAQRFRVNSPRDIALIWGTLEITWGWLLRGIYLVGMVLCAIAMGIHHRRGSGRFLLAMLAPWLLFVTFCAQVHERYILYPALISVPLLALGFGWWMVAIVLQLIALLPVLQGMLGGPGTGDFLAESMGQGFGYRLQGWVAATHPGMGWAMVVLALTVFYGAMNLRREHPKKAKPNEDDAEDWNP